MVLWGSFESEKIELPCNILLSWPQLQATRVTVITDQSLILLTCLTDICNRHPPINSYDSINYLIIYNLHTVPAQTIIRPIFRAVPDMSSHCFLFFYFYLFFLLLLRFSRSLSMQHLHKNCSANHSWSCLIDLGQGNNDGKLDFNLPFNIVQMTVLHV